MSTSRTPRPRRARRLVPLILAVLAAGAASGCTGQSGPRVPTLQSAGPKASPTAVSEEAAMLAYAACMRDHGIDMPDPIVSADGHPQMQYPDNLDKRAFGAADESCRSLLAQAYPANTPNPNGASEQDALLAYARCMRAHGIQMDDPTADGPGSVVVAGEQANDPGPAAASFQAADDACKDLLPGKPGSSDSPAASAPAPSGATPPAPSGARP